MNKKHDVFDEIEEIKMEVFLKALTDGQFEKILDEQYSEFLNFLIEHEEEEAFLINFPILDEGGSVWLKYRLSLHCGEKVVLCPPEIAIPKNDSDKSIPEGWEGLSVFKVHVEKQ